jgi:hypothetical protein
VVGVFGLPRHQTSLPLLGPQPMRDSGDSLAPTRRRWQSRRAAPLTMAAAKVISAASFFNLESSLVQPCTCAGALSFAAGGDSAR